MRFVTVILASALAGTSGRQLITSTGVGPVAVGMSVRQALDAGRGDVARVDSEPLTEGCSYLEFQSNDSIRVMIEGKRVVRVEVWAPGIPTPSGLQVGDSEARARRIYRNRMTIEEHKYEEGGHYFVVRTNGGTRAIVLDVHGGRVQAIRGGEFPAVMYVEGCA